MEALLSVLLFVAELLKDLPARASSLTEQRKTLLAKALTNFILLLDQTYRRGNSILLEIENLTNSLSPQDFDDTKSRLQSLIRSQIRDLKHIDKLLDVDINTALRDSDIQDLAHVESKSPDLRKVLSFYRPEMGDSIRSVVGFKLAVLRAFGLSLSKNSEWLRVNHIIAREIVYISERVDRYSLFGWKVSADELLDTLIQYNSRGLVVFKDIDLMVDSERSVYIQRARFRLEEIRKTCDDLRKLIEQYFEPHHLI